MVAMHRPRTSPDAGTPTSRTGRRAAVVVSVSLAGLAVVAVPFVLLTGERDAAPPRSESSGPPVTASASPIGSHAALTGDLDGDGVPDHVSLQRSGMLEARLGSGIVAHHLLQDSPRLEGLADVGGGGPALVTSSRRPDGRTWTVWRLQGRDLVPMPVDGSRALTSLAGSSVVWLSGRTLYDGTLDPLQRGEHEVAVVSRQWSLAGGRLVARSAGIRCWDRASDRPPTTCAPGQDWTYDVGPHGDLPTLLPADSRGTAGRSGTRTADGDVWTVRRAESPGPLEPSHWTLGVSGRLAARSVAVAPGSAPSLFRTPVRVGDLTQGVLLSQEGGDLDAWRVYVDWDGRIQELPTRGSVQLGGGFTGRHPEVAYLSWMSADGSLFTRIGEATPGRYRVYAWRPEDATAATAPTLVAQDLGTLCIDEMLGTYGTCGALSAGQES
jgi:hypothetical protein